MVLGEHEAAQLRPEVAIDAGHTNGSETDVRSHVSRRTVSGGTRSDLGRDCRDAFLALAKTCAKLEIAFWDYLGVRLAVAGSSQRKEPLDDTSGSVHILAIDVSDTATPSLRADHSQLPLRREIPEHGSDQQKRRHVANQVTCLVSVMRGLYCHDAGVHDARPDRE